MISMSAAGTFLPFRVWVWYLSLKARWRKVGAVPKPQKHDFSLKLTRVIKPKGGPGVELATLEEIAAIHPSLCGYTDTAHVQ